MRKFTMNLFREGFHGTIRLLFEQLVGQFEQLLFY
jgi:hypothetical protein